MAREIIKIKKPRKFIVEGAKPSTIITFGDEELTDILSVWDKASKAHDPKINLKKLSKITKKSKLKKESKLTITKTNKFLIESRKKSTDNFVIDLKDYYGNPDKYYSNIYYFISEIVDGGLTNELARENYVRFKFPLKEGVHKMSVIHFLYNMILWMPFFMMDIEISESKVFKPKDFTNSSYEKYINNEIILKYRYLTTPNQMSQMLAKMYDLFQRTSELSSLQLGISFSNYDILTKFDDIPELKELTHTRIPSKYQISEMEQFIAKQNNRMREILLDDNSENDSIKALLRSNQLNRKQHREYYISIGTKPDLKGNTYAIYPPAGSNFLINGLKGNKGLSIIVDALGARKAAIMNLNIDDGGYIQRAFCKSTNDIVLHPDPWYDCGSENYYTFHIKDEKDLKKMDGRYYFDHATSTNKQILESDTDMIGETLDFRTPVTCAGGRKGICRICYGNLYSQNYGTHAGIFSGLVLSERNYQMLLSAKHILETATGSIEFNDEFFIFFDFEEGYRIMLREDIEEREMYEIWINVNSLYVDSGNVKGREMNTTITKFIIYDTEKKEQIEMKDTNESDLCIGNQLFKIVERKRLRKEYNAKGWIRINLSELDPKHDIFYVVLKNNEITESLNQLRNLIEKGRLLGIDTVSDLINTLKNLMEKGNINVPSVHIEMLCRNLVRDVNNRTKLPDWHKNNPEYMITSIHNSIFWSESVVNSITFEHVKLQLRDPLTYRKNATSFLDPCFMLN